MSRKGKRKGSDRLAEPVFGTGALVGCWIGAQFDFLTSSFLDFTATVCQAPGLLGDPVTFTDSQPKYTTVHRVLDVFRFHFCFVLLLGACSTNVLVCVLHAPR
jgi:hypothetical protein